MPRNEYRSNLMMLAMGNVLALFLGTSTVSAAISDCNEYLTRAMSQIKLACIAGRNDEFARFRYNLDPAFHMDWCRKHTPQERALENQGRQNDLRRTDFRRCLVPNGPISIPDCNTYALRAMSQQGIAQDLHGFWPGQYGFPWVPCDFRGPRWFSTQREHFDWCQRQIGSMAAAEAEDFERRKALAACAPDGGFSATFDCKCPGT